MIRFGRNEMPARLAAVKCPQTKKEQPPHHQLRRRNLNERRNTNC